MFNQLEVGLLEVGGKSVKDVVMYPELLQVTVWDERVEWG